MIAIADMASYRLITRRSFLKSLHIHDMLQCNQAAQAEHYQLNTRPSTLPCDLGEVMAIAATSTKRVKVSIRTAHPHSKSTFQADHTGQQEELEEALEKAEENGVTIPSDSKTPHPGSLDQIKERRWLAPEKLCSRTSSISRMVHQSGCQLNLGGTRNLSARDTSKQDYKYPTFTSRTGSLGVL
jgi:hypothetical protein